VGWGWVETRVGKRVKVGLAVVGVYSRTCL
jgi:hypothetical protein